MARYALVVGISKYKSRHLADLSKPEQDAKAITTLLDKYGQFDTKPTVLTGAVTQSQLVKALRTLLEKQSVNSDVVIYFTGHGISVQDPFGDQAEGLSRNFRYRSKNGSRESRFLRERDPVHEAE